MYILTLPLFRFREVYGPFALSVTLLFWAFVGALILLFGAQLSVQDFGNCPVLGAGADRWQGGTRAEARERPSRVRVP